MYDCEQNNHNQHLKAGRAGGMAKVWPNGDTVAELGEWPEVALAIWSLTYRVWRAARDLHAQ
jgi:hypothetical protein